MYVNEFVLVQVDHESIVPEEVGTKDGVLDIGNDEDPGERASETQVESE